MEKKYLLEEILDIWEKDELGIHNFKEKGYNSWKEWRLDKMKKHGVKIKYWLKKEIRSEEVLNFRVGAFPSIRAFSEEFLNGDASNYLKINETKVEFFEEIYSRNEEKIASIMKNMPKEINFIAWKRNGEYILTEGHHRAIAIARVLKNNGKLEGVKLNLYYHSITGKEKIKNIDYI